MDKIINALKYVAGQLPGFLAAVLALAGLYVTGHVEWGNRIAEARLSEYQQITAQLEEANVLIDRFTRALAQNDSVDPEVVDLLAANLGVQYSRINRFETSLSRDGQAVAQEYRSSLNKLKFEVITVDELQDLEFVGATMAEMYSAQLRLLPYLAAAAGTAVEPPQPAGQAPSAA